MGTSSEARCGHSRVGSKKSPLSFFRDMVPRQHEGVLHECAKSSIYVIFSFLDYFSASCIFYKGQLTFFKVENKHCNPSIGNLGISEFLKTISSALSVQTMFINKLQVHLLVADFLKLIYFGVWTLEACIMRCAYVFLSSPVYIRVFMYWV